MSEKHGKNGTAGSRTRTAFLASLECYRYTTVPLLKTQAYAVGYPPLQEEALLRGANRGQRPALHSISVSPLHPADLSRNLPHVAGLGASGYLLSQDAYPKITARGAGGQSHALKPPLGTGGYLLSQDVYPKTTACTSTFSGDPLSHAPPGTWVRALSLWGESKFAHSGENGNLQSHRGRHLSFQLRVFELSLPLDAPETAACLALPLVPPIFCPKNMEKMEPPGVEPEPPSLQVWSATATLQSLC